ncbi:MAG: PAS domain S-box protein [Candidatus Omnitrophota bacterium]
MKIASKITLSFFITGLILSAIIGLIVASGLNVIFLFFLIPVAAALIGFIISKIFTKPVQELYKGIKIVRSGNLDYKVELDTKDELEKISKAFDAMAKDLSKANLSMEGLRKEDAGLEAKIKDLKDSEEHFRRLFELSNDAIFIYDFEGKITGANNKACDMLGYAKEELLKVPFLELHTEEELTKSKRAYKIGADTCSLRFESKFKKKDGSIIDVEISSSCVDLKSGVMQGVVSNITERKELEEALKESEEKFRTFMETASDLMYIADKGGKLTYVNEAMINSLGYERGEMIGMPLTEILTQKSLEDFKLKRRELMDKGEVIYEPAWETKDLRKIDGELRVVAMYDSEGNFAGSRGIFRDITERKKIEEAQRLSHLGKLAADVAHEVNNPVTIISGNAELALMEKPGEKEIKKTFEIILDQCSVATDIIKRLLMFSKPSEQVFKEVDINESIDVTVKLIETHFRHGGVKIEKKLVTSLPPVKVDEKQMQEVFINLMRNAFEAMGKGGKVTITTKEEDSHVRIDFTDTGPGIPEENIEKILDPFFTTKKEGTGLGLSVCYGILKAHGGDLKYTSKPGEGTTATVLLPIAGRK